MSARPVLLAAGGTGGHLFPAEALAGELVKRGVPVHLATDRRAMHYTGSFPAQSVHRLASGTISGRHPMAVVSAGFRMVQGLAQAFWLLKRLKPAAVVGFGGYPTVPPMLVAQWLGIPTIVHEQNAVLGRANRLLAKKARVVATGFPRLAKTEPEIAAKTQQVGNPVRAVVHEAATLPFIPPVPGRRIALLVFGGSQGARVMTEVAPAAVQRVDAGLRKRLHVVQQARESDLAWARAAYAAAEVSAEVAPFFKDLPERMAQAHLVIGRAGASTVAELALIGRPSILVPLPGSLDQDQLANAAVLGDLGAATVVAQQNFTPDALAELLSLMLGDGAWLEQAARSARMAAVPDAAVRLADLVLSVS